MDDSRSGFVILLLGAPKVLECAERSQNRSPNPDGVLALGRCNNLDFDAGRRESSKFLGHAVSNTGEHRGTTGQDDIAVELATDIQITFGDRVISESDVRLAKVRI